MRFPSVEWFKALCELANANPERLRRLGTVDLVLVAKIDFDSHSRFFEIVFAGYHCQGAREIPYLADAERDAVVLEAAYPVWCEMIANIQKNGQADLEHTLNTLTLYDTPMRVFAESQLDTDLFYRYQQNLQEFFDAASKLKSEFSQAQESVMH